MAEQSRRFVSLDKPIDKFIEDQKDKNTLSKTRRDVSLLTEFLNSKNESRRIEEIPPKELNEYISEFIVAVRRKDGDDFEPSSLRGLICGLPGEEGFYQVGMEENIPQELLRYLKQQNLSSDPLLPAMQRLQSGMDGTLSRSDLGEDEKAKQFLQLQNRYLTFKRQLNTYTPLPARNRPEEINTSQPEVNVPTVPTPVEQPPAIIPATPMQAQSLEPTAKALAPKALSTTTTYTPAPSSLPPSILTPPPSVKSQSPMPSPPKRKRQRKSFCKLLRR